MDLRQDMTRANPFSSLMPTDTEKCRTQTNYWQRTLEGISTTRTVGRCHGILSKQQPAHCGLLRTNLSSRCWVEITESYWCTPGARNIFTTFSHYIHSRISVLTFARSSPINSRHTINYYFRETNEITHVQPRWKLSRTVWLVQMMSIKHGQTDHKTPIEVQELYQWRPQPE